MTEEIKRFTREEVSKHTADGDLWVIIDNAVYDMGPFQEQHPGGKKILLSAAGTDATKKYHKHHGEKTMARYGDNLRIGFVDGSGPGTTKKPAEKKGFLSRFRRSG